MDNQFHLYAPITKVNKENRTVEGYATSEDIDQSSEIVDYAASKKAFSAWKGNIREMHQPKAVGKAIEILPDDNKKGVYVSAYISKGAEDTWQKVLDGTLQGFSIGGSVLNKTVELHKATGKQIKRITDYKVRDGLFPCNMACGINIVKLADDNQLDVTDIVSQPEETPESSETNTTKSQGEGSEITMELEGRLTKIEEALSEILSKMSAKGKLKKEELEEEKEETEKKEDKEEEEVTEETEKAEHVCSPSAAEALPGTEGLQNKRGDITKPKNTNVKPEEAEVTGAGAVKAAGVEAEAVAEGEPVEQEEEEQEEVEEKKAKKVKKAEISEDLQKSFVEPLAALTATVTELKKVVDDFMGEPLPRKAVVIEKRFAANAEDQEDVKKSTPAEDVEAEEIQKLAAKKRSGANMTADETYKLDKALNKMLSTKFTK